MGQRACRHHCHPIPPTRLKFMASPSPVLDLADAAAYSNAPEKVYKIRPFDNDGNAVPKQLTPARLSTCFFSPLANSCLPFCLFHAPIPDRRELELMRENWPSARWSSDARDGLSRLFWSFRSWAMRNRFPDFVVSPQQKLASVTLVPEPFLPGPPTVPPSSR
ncbi:hypothetical protein NL676_031089 [Syzygium grande]|nr:hypothetical protein NL676_031089 [Syzygium grande]